MNEKSALGANAPPVFAADRPTPAPADRMAALFAELVAHGRAQGPITLAVTGPAGAGKSSFLESVLARAEAIAAAAAGKTSPFLSRLLVTRIEAADAAADPVGAIAAASERAMRRAGADWSKTAAEAAASLADPQVAAREAGEAFDAIRRRLDEETRSLEEAQGRRARLADLLLYETAGSKVDSYARGHRSRLEAGLKRFGFTEADATVAYKNLVGEVAEQGGAAAAPMLLRSLWAFRGQKRLIVLALLFALFWLGLGLAQETHSAWSPWLRDQGQAGAAAVEALLSRGWLAILQKAAIAAAGLVLALNVWRAWRFTTPLLRGARLLKADVAERAAELDGQIEARSSRLAALRREAETARARADEAARRAAEGGAGPGADASAFGPLQPAQAYLAALDAALARQRGGARLVVALDGLDRIDPAAAARLVEAAQRALSAPHWALIAAFDLTRLAPEFGAAPAARRAQFERLFQLGWRLDGDVADASRLLGEWLGATVAPGAAPPPDAGRSLLDEPLSATETDLLARLAPLAGATARGLKRFANLYRVARMATPDRAAVALMLAVETSGRDDDVIGIARALAAGQTESPGDPRLVEAVRAARQAAGDDLGVARLMAARRLARRLSALGAGEA
ncbi:MAG: hypothetical protein JNK46_12660 [Methylobacteriaceae bacterium]|nr:hypothetical protein [Methylobacteriaceae bacterium]